MSRASENRQTDRESGIPISRRGLLAGMAVLAGLGFSGLAAFADDYSEDHGNGVAGQYHWGDYYNHCLYNGNGFGCASSWLDWTAYSGQDLRVAFAVEMWSNYTNPLYEYCRLQAYSQCGDTNYVSTHRLWYARVEDNFIDYYWNGSHWRTDTGAFAWTNEFLDPGYGRYDTLMHTFGYKGAGWLERKGSDYRAMTLGATLNIFNVTHGSDLSFVDVYPGVKFDPSNAAHREWVQFTLNTQKNCGGDLTAWLDKILIRNRCDLFGAIVSVTNRFSDSDLVIRSDGSGEWSRLCQKKGGASSTDGNFAIELGSACDEFGDFLHCLKSVCFKGWNSTLYAESGRDILAKGMSADTYPNNDSGLSNAYYQKLWAWHKPQVSNFCNFWLTDSLQSEEGYSQLVSNETGLCLSLTRGVKNDGADICLWHSGTWNGTKGVSSVDWKIAEVLFEGDISFKELADGSKEIEIEDPSSSCTPTDFYKTLSIEYLTRFILSDSNAGVKSNSLDIVGGASQAPWGMKWYKEHAANRMVGFPFLTVNLMRGFYLKLSSPDVSGSICYSIMKSADGDWSETYRDGQWTDYSDESRIWGIKMWLEGEVSNDFDLSIRCCTEKAGWGQRHESFKVDAEHAPEISFAGERLIAFQVEAVPRPAGAVRLLADFSNSLKVQLPDDAAGYIFAQTCLVRNAAYATIDSLHSAAQRYRGTVTSSKPLFIGGTKVVYHADGVDDESIVFTETVKAGAHTASADATSAALKSHCNLNEHFDEDPSTGFTDWFTDKELTIPYGGSELSAGDELHLYGRNRCTVRIDYAEGSIRPQEGMIFRDGATDSAAEVADALGLTDFSGAETHAVDGITLPTIGDDGLGHKAVYWGERVAPAKPTGVYSKQPDGTWRRYVAECWLTTAGGGPQSHQSRRSGTLRSTSSGPWRSQTASRAQRSKYRSGRRCRLRPEAAHVPCGRCA